MARKMKQGTASGDNVKIACGGGARAGAGRAPRDPIRSTPFGHVLSLGAN